MFFPLISAADGQRKTLTAVILKIDVKNQFSRNKVSQGKNGISFVPFYTKVDIEMDGKMLNSHGVDFLDGPLGLDLDEKDLDEEETRRDMAKILKELKQKHPDKEVCNVDV